jgi:quinol-cytochrome oxidoreductase complex cytochrome b subunit
MSDHAFKNRTIRWIDSRLPIFSIMYHSTSGYPAPKNFNYWWNFGSLALFMLVVMVVTGIFLAMNYTPESTMAFNSVERIMRDVNYGWLLRYIHSNGASMFFFVVYVHIFRGLYYGSYKAPRELLWWLGLIIYIIMMATAFMGYVLPWGQMSFWAATVITNIFTAIPLVGNAITTWLWGGFSVGNPTLNRFFALHYLLPFVILAVVGLHLWALHTSKSNNPLGIEVKGPQDTVPFHPYYTVKDLFGVGVLVMVYAAFVFFAPNFFVEPDNYIPANPLVTPNHIVPEWYLLPFYAMLRSIPDILFIPAKLAGVLTLALALLILFVVPWLDTSRVRSAKFRPIYKQVFWIFLLDCLWLGYIGAQVPNDSLIFQGRVATILYFGFFVIFMPLCGWFEKTRPLPTSISAPVLKQEKA